MKVLINQTPALRQKSGMGHYVANLIRCLQAQAGSDRVLLFPGAAATLGLAGARKLKAALATLKNCLRGPGPRNGRSAPRASGEWLKRWGRWGLEWNFRLACANGNFDLYHEPNFIAHPCSRPTIITVADLSPLLHPEWHPAERVHNFARNFERGLAQSVHVITISEFCRQELLRHLNLPADRVSCTYMGVRADFQPLPRPVVAAVLERLRLPKSYLLFVGTLEPRKNLMTLMRAYVGLPAALRERCPLVLVGGWGWNTSELADFYNQEARHQGVMHLGYAADEDLPALYNGARALVFPSHYEGFGLPPVEMLACGGPVLASTAGALVETVGAHAELIDPLDQDGWQLALRRVIEDDAWQRQLCCGGIDFARTYSWERCAADTWGVYRRVLGELGPVCRAA